MKLWELAGQSGMTREQQKLLNAACGDLARGLRWHSNRLTKEDWRHLLAGTLLGWRMMPGVDLGSGAPGFIMLGGSSLDLTKTQASEAITLAFSIGDDPSSQGLNSPPVRWCDVVCLARGITNSELEAA